MQLDKISKSIFSRLLSLYSDREIDASLQNIYQQIKNGKTEYRNFLGDYALFGISVHNKILSLKLLSETVEPGETKFLPYFLHYVDLLKTPYFQKMCELGNCGASKPNDTEMEKYFTISLENFSFKLFYSFSGYLKIKGKEGYPRIVDIITDKELPDIVRIIARDRLYIESKDAPLIFSKDKYPGCTTNDAKKYWYVGRLEEKSMRVDAVKKWADAGYPEPVLKAARAIKRNEALSNPQTTLEYLCANLEKNKAVAKEGTESKVIFAYADNEEFEDAMSIQKKLNIKLPTIYLEFLKNLSPQGYFELINLEKEDPEDEYTLHLANASNFEEFQDSFAFISSERNNDWPANHIVIGKLEIPISFGYIAFYMDLSQSDGTDAPIFCNVHDGPEAIPVSKSFLSFLEMINSQKGWNTLIQQIDEI